MPDVNYIITIRHDGGNSGKSGSNSGVAPTVSGESTSNEGTIGNVYEGVKAATKIAPIAYALKLADSVVTTNINRVSLRTGHTTYQERTSWAYSTAKKALTTGAMLVGGIVTANPAIIAGAAISVANQGLELYRAQENLQIAESVEDVGIGLANIRAGSLGDRARKGSY